MTIVVWVRPRIRGAFRAFQLGVFRVKEAKVPLPIKFAFGTPKEFSKDINIINNPYK